MMKTQRISPAPLWLSLASPQSPGSCFVFPQEKDEVEFGDRFQGLLSQGKELLQQIGCLEVEELWSGE